MAVSYIALKPTEDGVMYTKECIDGRGKIVNTTSGHLYNTGLAKGAAMLAEEETADSSVKRILVSIHDKFALRKLDMVPRLKVVKGPKVELKVYPSEFESAGADSKTVGILFDELDEDN